MVQLFLRYVDLPVVHEVEQALHVLRPQVPQQDGGVAAAARVLGHRAEHPLEDPGAGGQDESVCHDGPSSSSSSSAAPSAADEGHVEEVLLAAEVGEGGSHARVEVVPLQAEGVVRRPHRAGKGGSPHTLSKYCFLVAPVGKQGRNLSGLCLGGL